MPYYRVDSTVPSYANRFGLGDKYVFANSPSEARRTALALIGPNLPAATLTLSPVSGVEAQDFLQPLTRQSTGQQVTAVDPTGYTPSEFEEGLGESGFTGVTDPSNIEGLYRGRSYVPPGANLPKFTGSDVPGFNLPYRGTGQAAGGGFTEFTNELEGGPQNLLYPANATPPRRVTLPYDATAGPPKKELLQGFGMADELYAIDPSTAGGSGSYSIGYDPYFYGDEYTPPTPKAVIPAYDPLGAAGETLGFDPEARGIDIDELDRQEAERAGLEARKKLAEERAKEAALLTGAVRSWDAKLADITLSYDEKGNVSVNLPVDMWRNADDRPGNIADQTIGKEQIEDAIRRLAELGGRDTLNRSVEHMLQQARRYYANTPRGDSTWDRNIDGGLIPEDERKPGTGTSFLNDSAWKATWGGLADEVLDPKKESIESGIPSGWADNVAGYNQLNEYQKKLAGEHNLNSMKEIEDFYANNAWMIANDPGALVTGDTEGKTEDIELPPADPKTEPGVADGSMAGGEEGMFGDANQFDFAQGGMEGFQTSGAGGTGTTGTGAFDGLMAGAGTGLGITGGGTPGVPAFSSQDLINDPQGFLTGAGQRLAFRNVFGEPATAVGPLASYLQRQTFPLTQAYRARSFADMGREQAGEVAPQTTFEDFLRTVRDQPTGLSGAYGQALQNVNYLRGLGSGQAPPALAGVFNPEQAAATRDARALLDAAQRGKYSKLVSSAFRRPTEEDLFSDYVLARQDAATAGTAPQNFLNFAASRFGL